MEKHYICVCNASVAELELVFELDESRRLKHEREVEEQHQRMRDRILHPRRKRKRRATPAAAPSAPAAAGTSSEVQSVGELMNGSDSEDGE